MAVKCIEFRKLRKQGAELSIEADAFCMRMCGTYPVWYSKMEERVFGKDIYANIPRTDKTAL